MSGNRGGFASGKKSNKSTDYIKAKNEDNTYDYMARDFSVKLTAGEETILNGFINPLACIKAA